MFAFAFVIVFALLVVVLGLFFGKSHGHRSAGLVIAQAQAQGAIADPFAVDGQGAGKGSDVGLEPSIETVGQCLGIRRDQLDQLLSCG